LPSPDLEISRTAVDFSLPAALRRFSSLAAGVDDARTAASIEFLLLSSFGEEIPANPRTARRMSSTATKPRHLPVDEEEETTGAERMFREAKRWRTWRGFFVEKRSGF